MDMTVTKEAEFILIGPLETGSMPHRATWAALGPVGRQREKGKCWHEPLSWLLQEGASNVGTQVQVGWFE